MSWRRGTDAFYAVALGVLAACRTVPVESTVAGVQSQTLPNGVTWTHRLGIVWTDQTSLRVAEAIPVSAACIFGLRPDDTVTALNGVAVTSPATFERAAEENINSRFSPWCFTVRHDDGRTERLPYGCDWATFLKTPANRGFWCIPTDLGLCGPLPSECVDEAAR